MLHEVSSFALAGLMRKRSEALRQPQILGIINRTVKDRRYFTLQRVDKDGPQLRWILQGIPNNAEAFRITHEIGVAEFHGRCPAKPQLLLPANHAVSVVPPDQNSPGQSQTHRCLKLLRVHQKSTIS